VSGGVAPWVGRPFLSGPTMRPSRGVPRLASGRDLQPGLPGARPGCR